MDIIERAGWPKRPTGDYGALPSSIASDSARPCASTSPSHSPAGRSSPRFERARVRSAGDVVADIKHKRRLDISIGHVVHALFASIDRLFVL